VKKYWSLACADRKDLRVWEFPGTHMCTPDYDRNKALSDLFSPGNASKSTQLGVFFENGNIVPDLDSERNAAGTLLFSGLYNLISG